MNDHRIERLLSDGDLVAVEEDVRSIVAHWEAALRDRSVAKTAELPPDAAFRFLYTSGLQVATAVLRAAGYRARGRRHHYATFYALRGLDHEALNDLGAEMDGFRPLRHRAVYEPEARLEAEEVEAMAAAVERLFAAANRYVIDRHPSLEGRLEIPV